jgi:hypothetical protein
VGTSSIHFGCKGCTQIFKKCILHHVLIGFVPKNCKSDQFLQKTAPRKIELKKARETAWIDYIFNQKLRKNAKGSKKRLLAFLALPV